MSGQYAERGKSMEVSRRDFLKLSGAGAGGIFLYGILKPDKAYALPKQLPLKKKIGERTTICPYCGVGCGAIMAVEDGKIVNIEGDPDHPINEGSLCSKGASLRQLADNSFRLTRVLYRPPAGTEWEEKTWDWAIEQIAKKIKTTRDASWIDRDKEGRIINRTEAIASVGSVFPNSEEAYLMTKLQRALGMVYIENEARLCVSSAVAANEETLGRGPMTNHWIDLVNSDCIMAIGANVAETFPNAFKWITRAKEKGAKFIHVDPRFTRTSAKADIYARLRTGTDIAFVGGMIKYVLDDMERNPQSYNMEYVREYTTASFLINPNFGFKDGLFTGWDAAKKSYDKSTWQYQMDENGVPRMDKSLQDPNCVFQLLKRHFSRYDVDTVCAITGTPKDTYLEVCQTYAATGEPGKAGAIVLSSGACEHTHGTQNVRAYGILQLILGNMGVAGGGLNGIAGAVNGLGCSLQGRLFHWLPGTMSPPMAQYDTLDKYLNGVTPPKSKVANTTSPWTDRPKHIVSLLKAWYGEHATGDDEFAYHYLPKLSGNYSWMPLFEAMHDGKVKGLICWGMNPAVSGANSTHTREALEKLEWMVVIDLFETETAAVWKRPSIDPTKNNTEVFLLPAASSVEKEGSVTSSARWMQWRYKGGNPPGEAKEDLWIINKLMLKLKDLYTGEGGPHAEAIINLTWDYGDPPDVHRVAREINGYNLTTGKLLPSSLDLKDDGTTSCGNWLFCGSYTEAGNMAAQRDSVDTTGIGLFPGWAWAWPLNRRIWYNRASVDLAGNPWDKTHPVIQWDAAGKKWVGDAPDGGPPPGAIYPFIMNWEGRGRLFGPGRADGPLPEHYEPCESPVMNPMSPTQCSPVMAFGSGEVSGTADKYPILATTFRVVEHLHSGSFTRNLPWLVEMMPEMFVEISEELAMERGMANGSKVIIRCARGEIKAVAMVTRRLQPLAVNGRKIHQIALPWHWGYMGLSKGDSANMLTPRVCDPNTMIPEFRAFLCDVSKA
jgi:formate dehydrogenase major subunit